MINITLIASLVAVWSAVNIAGVHLSKVRNDIEHIAALECTAPTVSEFDSEPFIIDEKLIEENNQATNNSWESSIHRAVVQSAYEIIRLKGYTSWAIGLTVCDIVAAIMHNSRQIYALSTNSKVFCLSILYQGLYEITIGIVWDHKRCFSLHTMRRKSSFLFADLFPAVQTLKLNQSFVLLAGKQRANTRGSSRSEIKRNRANTEVGTNVTCCAK